MKNGDERNIVWMPKTASTLFTKNSVVGFTSGQLVNAGTEIVGVIKRDVVATDGDYASASDVPVEIWYPGALIEADVTVGSASATSVGVKYDIDTSTSPYLGITTSGTSNKVFLVLKVITSLKVLGMVTGSIWNDVS